VWNILAAEMAPLMGEAASSSATQALGAVESVTANMNLQGVFNQINQQAVEYAEERAAEMVGMRLVNGTLIANPNAKWTITEPTRDWLRDSIQSAFEDGMSPAALAKLIRSNYAFSAARAKTIAFTEIGNVNVRTHAETATQAGATHKKTSLSADHDQDDFCDEAAEAGEVPIDHDYGLGMQFPLFHPRCKCSVTFYFREQRVAA
jgi:hypothetical protein